MYVNILSTEKQFRLFAREIEEPAHIFDYMHDHHFNNQFHIACKYFPGKHFYMTTGEADCAFSGPSAGFGIYFLLHSVVNKYLIGQRYVFSGELGEDELIPPGDLPDKIPYIIPGQCLVLPGNTRYGGYTSQGYEILHGPLDKLSEFFNAQSSKISFN